MCRDGVGFGKGTPTSRIFGWSAIQWNPEFSNTRFFEPRLNRKRLVGRLLLFVGGGEWEPGGEWGREGYGRQEVESSKRVGSGRNRIDLVTVFDAILT